MIEKILRAILSIFSVGFFSFVFIIVITFTCIFEFLTKIVKKITKKER